MVNDIIKLSYENDLSHIPSALSMVNYLDRLYYNKILSKQNHTVIGKPHGAQSYFYIWKKYGLIDDYNNISTSLKNNDVDFLDFSIDILGDALGVGSGIAHVSEKLVWVNIGDGVLQMGNTLEAIQYIGTKQIKNILCTVDFNKSQRCGNLLIDIEPVINFCKEYNWNVYRCNGHNNDEIDLILNKLKFDKPTIIFFDTIKGHGVDFMEKNIKEWHYKKIDEKYYRQIFR